jgi:hypothetical protein
LPSPRKGRRDGTGRTLSAALRHQPAERRHHRSVLCRSLVRDIRLAWRWLVLVLSAARLLGSGSGNWSVSYELRRLSPRDECRALICAGRALQKKITQGHYQIEPAASPMLPRNKKKKPPLGGLSRPVRKLESFWSGRRGSNPRPDLGKVVVLFQVVAKAPWIAPKHSV